MTESVTAHQDAATHPTQHPGPQAGLQLGGLMIGIAVFLTVKEAFELYLAYRQLRRVQKVKTPPKELADIVTEEELLKANAYAEDRLKFGMIRSVWGTLLLVAELYYGIWPWLWDVALKAGNAASGGRVNENGKIHSLIFFLMQSQLSKIMDLPWDLYHTFVIEERHGFNKQTIGLYFADMAKGLVLEIVFSTLIISGVIAVVEYTGDKFYVYLTILALVLNFLMMWIVPNFIQPWFNKFSPLPEGSLRAGIESLAQRVKFPLQKIFVMDAGKRSGHSNAYFYGFWKHQRIVLFDTMLNDFKDPEQIYAVLAHELGHWHHGHTFQGMALGLIESFAAIYTFKHVNQSNIYELFGFNVGSRRPVMIGMFLFFELVWAPVGTVVGFLTNLTTRCWEKQADAYSADLGFAEPLKAGLVVLNRHNKSTVDPDWLYSSYHHSHPPLMHRLRSINEHVQKTSGKKIQDTKKAQ